MEQSQGAAQSADVREWRELLAKREERLKDDPAEMEDDGLDAQFIKALLTACLENVDAWTAQKGVQQTRKHIRQIFALYLHKKGEHFLPPTGEEEERMLERLFQSCLQCRTAYYTCPNPPHPSCGNYDMFKQCMKGCSP